MPLTIEMVKLIHLIAVINDRLVVQKIFFQFVRQLAAFILLATRAKYTALVFDESSSKFGIPSSTASIVKVNIFSYDALTKKPLASLKGSLDSQFHRMQRFVRNVCFQALEQAFKSCCSCLEACWDRLVFQYKSKRLPDIFLPLQGK